MSMILIIQGNNQIGGTERQTQYFLEYLQSIAFPFLIIYTKPIGVLDRFRYYFAAINIFVTVILNRPTAIYVMLDIAPPDSPRWKVTLPFYWLLRILAQTGTNIVIRNTGDGWTKRWNAIVSTGQISLFRYIAISNNEKRLLQELNNNCIVTIIMNCCNTQVFNFRPRQANKNSIVFGYVGRFVQRKNLDLLVKAISIIPKTLRKRISVKLLGYDLACCATCTNYFKVLKKSVQSLKLEKTILLYPKIAFGHESSLSNFLDGIDIFILPSQQEGTSNAAVECIATGRPVIYYKKNLGVKDIVNNTRGWSFLKLNAKSIAQTMIQALQQYSDNGPYYQLKCRDYANKNFSITKSMQSTLSFLVNNKLPRCKPPR